MLTVLTLGHCFTSGAKLVEKVPIFIQHLDGSKKIVLSNTCATDTIEQVKERYTLKNKISPVYI